MREDAKELLEIIGEVHGYLEEDVRQDPANVESKDLLALFTRVHTALKEEKTKQFFSDMIHVLSFLEAEEGE
jgi:hypothetical protein